MEVITKAASATAVVAGGGEGGHADKSPEEIAQTVKLLANEAAIRDSIARESAGKTAPQQTLGSPLAGPEAGSGSTPIKRPRGRPRKHPPPDPSAPKRPRGRPRKIKDPPLSVPVPVPVPVPVSEVPASAPVRVIPGPVPIAIPATSATVAVAVAAGTSGVQSTPFVPTQPQQMATAVRLIQTEAGSPGVQVVSDQGKMILACVGAQAATRIAVPLTLLPQLPDDSWQGRLLVAEPAFPLVHPDPVPVPVTVQSNGREGEVSRKEKPQGSGEADGGTPSVDVKEKEEARETKAVPVVTTTSLTKPSQLAVETHVVPPVSTPLTPTKRPRGRPRKHPLPDAGTTPGNQPNQHPDTSGTHPLPNVEAPPKSEPSLTPVTLGKRPRGRPRKTPLVQAQPTPGTPKEVVEEVKETVTVPERDEAKQLATPPIKRPRGRPPKKASQTQPVTTPSTEKRPRGRPRKNPLPVQQQAPSTAEGTAAVGTPQTPSVVSPSKPTRGRPRKHPLPLPEGDSEVPISEATPTKRPRGRPRKQATVDPPPATAAVPESSTCATPTPVKRKRGRPPKHSKTPPNSSVAAGEGSTSQSQSPGKRPSPKKDGDEPANGSTGIVKRKRGRPRKHPLPTTGPPAVAASGASGTLGTKAPSLINPEQWSSSEGYHTSSTTTHEHVATAPDGGGVRGSNVSSDVPSEGGLQLAVTFSDSSSESEGEERAKMLTALAKRVCDEGEKAEGVAKPEDEEEVDVLKYSPPLEPRFEESYDDDSSCSDISTH